MRILAGELKYKKIKYIKDDKLRPTRNIVKKSFFDTIRPVIGGSVFLDLFAGAGSVGLEALSRGAKEVIFVDRSFRSIEIIKENVRMSGYSARVLVVKSDALSFIENFDRLQDVDLVYMDAPYGMDTTRLLEKFFVIADKNAIVCVEHGKDGLIKESFGKFVNIKSKRIGKNMLDYFGVADE